MTLKLAMLLLSLSILISSISSKLLNSKPASPSKLPNDRIKVSLKPSKDQILIEAHASGAIKRVPTQLEIKLSTQAASEQSSITSLENLRKKVLFDLIRLGVNADKISFYDKSTQKQSLIFVSHMKANIQILNKKEIVELVRRYIAAPSYPTSPGSAPTAHGSASEKQQVLTLLSVKNEKADENLVKEKIVALRKKIQEAAEKAVKDFYSKENKPFGKLVSQTEKIDKTSNLFENGSPSEKKEFSGKEDLQVVNLIYYVNYVAAVGSNAIKSGRSDK